MSVVQFPEAMDSSSADLQIWNNAAFDSSNGEDLTASRQSWGSLESIFGNPKASFDSDSGKENNPCAALESNDNQVLVSSVYSSPSLKPSNAPFKPVNIDIKSRIEGFVSKKGSDENLDLKKIRDEKKIDEEIEEIESKILRLNSRLEALRVEKAGMSVKIVEKRGRVVPAKFMDPKQSVKNSEDKRMIDEVSSVMSARTKFQRRGISLGPVEIISGARRGTSIGPSEIFGATKPRQIPAKQETMMITPIQSRRKSCFYKLKGIDEEKAAVKPRGKSCSVSPKSRKVTTRAQAITSRQAVTTIASRKSLKKDDSVINSVQPKKLFREGENSKKPMLRPGRVVASRYNQSNNNPSQAASAMRKRSLPENNDYGVKFDNKRALSVGKTRVNANLGGESGRVKKCWEIPNEIVVHGSMEGEKESPHQCIGVVPDLLPRIKIGRCAKESPRDSGPAKKVVELIGRKSFFANDEEDVGPFVCQALTYADNDEEEEEEGAGDFSFAGY